MKKFTGNVFLSNPSELIVNKRLTWVHIHYQKNDAPLFEEGTNVTVESQSHFPITISQWTNEWGKLITDRVRGKYYMGSDGVEISEVSHD